MEAVGNKSQWCVCVWCVMCKCGCVCVVRLSTPLIHPTRTTNPKPKIQHNNPPKNRYRFPCLLVPLGGDFEFQNASVNFGNMSQIMDFVNAADPGRYVT